MSTRGYIISTYVSLRLNIPPFCLYDVSCRSWVPCPVFPNQRAFLGAPQDLRETQFKAAPSIPAPLRGGTWIIRQAGGRPPWESEQLSDSTWQGNSPDSDFPPSPLPDPFLNAGAMNRPRDSVRTVPLCHLGRGQWEKQWHQKLLRV